MLFFCENILHGIKESILPLLTELNICERQIALIEQQYNKINLIDWENKTDTIKFWSEVVQYKGGAGKNPFKELCDIAMHLLILPISNAEIEKNL